MLYRAGLMCLMVVFSVACLDLLQAIPARAADVGTFDAGISKTIVGSPVNANQLQKLPMGPLVQPIVHGSVAAPLGTQDGPLTATPRTDAVSATHVTIAEEVSEPKPTSSRSGFSFAIATFIALVLRFVVGLLKSASTSGTSIWAKTPQWGQWVILGIATFALTLVDTWLTGASWGTAFADAAAGFVGSWGSQKVASITATNKTIAQQGTATS